ncbi:MAG: branched-chain amino acid ABC transporter permease [Desulfobacteraceae bacterium]|nr:MAG: branched-chain amino acid ABC transporter permease [Desulfobacteraceae bacterium]
MACGLFKTSYREDIRIFQTLFVKFWLAVLVGSLLLFPFLVGDYFLYTANLCGIGVIGALGLNILSGYTGQISLGHAAFIAIGAYGSTILTTKLGVPFLVSIFLGGIISAFSGLLVAIPCLRLKGLYLAIATFAFYFIVEYVIVHWTAVTNGTGGLSVPKARLFGFLFNTDRSKYFLILVLVLGAVIFAKNLLRTEAGRAFIAVRDNDIAAEVIGIDVTRYKIKSFMLSSFYAGVAGSLYAMTLSFIGPEHFTFLMTIEYLAMVLVGGVGTIAGTVFGAVFMTLLPEAIRLLRDAFSQDYPFLVTRMADLQASCYGLVIILFLIFEPKGLFGIWVKLRNYWKGWPYTY